MKPMAGMKMAMGSFLDQAIGVRADPFHRHIRYQAPLCVIRCSKNRIHPLSHPTNQHQAASVGFGRTESVCDGRQQCGGVTDRQDSFEVEGGVRHRRC